MTSHTNSSTAPTRTAWASDAVASLIENLGFEYIALVPGSSFRGLHDSLVNFLGPEWTSKLLVCLHEEHAVAIAHGYAKVTDRPMLAIVHANVGLMHATMAFYGAWCDRAPVVVLGANGPHDATKRRPWIDWIHTFRDPAALVRAYTKWDDEPGSARAMLDSITRAYQISMTRPYGPTFVVLDVAIQEERFEAPSLVEGLQRFAPPTQSSLSAADVARVADRLCAAKSPVILLGRGSRDIAAWDARIRLAEALGARVISDSRAGAAFPTRHPLHVGVPFVRLPPEANEIVRRADVILALECIDLNGTLVGAFGIGPIPAYLIACSLDRYVHNGASMDHGAMAPADLQFAADAESFTRDLGAEIDRRRGRSEQNSPPPAVRAPAPHDDRSIINTASLLDTLELQFSGTEVCYIRLPIAAYDSISMPLNHPLDYLGGDGAGGIGAGPGLAVGAALALRASGRLPVAVLGDGDYLMGLTALWTAVANGIPLLVVVANNRVYNNDVQHQERVARDRERPVERKWIGQRLDDPPPDLAMLARGQGAIGIGPVYTPSELRAALVQGMADVRAGKVVVIDAIVPALEDPRGEAMVQRAVARSAAP